LASKERVSNSYIYIYDQDYPATRKRKRINWIEELPNIWRSQMCWYQWQLIISMNHIFGQEKIIKTLSWSLKTIYQTFPFVKNIHFRAIAKASLNLIPFLLYIEKLVKFSLNQILFVLFPKLKNYQGNQKLYLRYKEVKVILLTLF
jgi:hypothetical protein